MRSPADMQIVLIDITNACNQRCSNCTRFCGNHKKPFFMDFETFRRAVDSFDGFEGLVALIGGEPTLHPEFERFAGYLREKYGEFKDRRRLAYPQKEFIEELLRCEFESHVLRRREDGEVTFERSGPGLYSNMGPSYRKHHELIQDTFHVQFLNDHLNASLHQPGLFSRKDLGIPDDEWLRLRDNCWLQNAWSASVTPKGAFFCEIAAALDMLFDGPGGWPIEPGWWKRKPEDFGEQLQWCELCGFAFETFVRPSDEGVDDASPTLYRMLEEIGSPRLKEGKTNCVKITDGVIDERSKAHGKRFTATQVYVEHYEDRFNAERSALLTDRFDTAWVPDGKGFGRAFNRALAGAKDWVLFCERPEPAEAAARELIGHCILNPGTMHMGDGFWLFSKNASALRRLGFDRIAHTEGFDEILAAWEEDKVVRLADTDEAMQWSRESIIPGKRYAIWGMGVAGSFLAHAALSSGGVLAFAVDKDRAKWGVDFYGAAVHDPAYLAGHPADYDFLLIGHYSRFAEIRAEAVALGVPEQKIMMPYEV